MSVRNLLSETAIASSGVQQRTLDANIGHRMANGAYSSNKGFISGDQIKARNKYVRDYNNLTDSFNEQKNTRIDEAQSALVNIGGDVSRGSGLSSNTGYLAIQRPYVVMSIPNISLPEDYGHYYGFPCNMTKQLSELSGFTVVKDCHLDGFSCTKTELDEIEALLKSGVII